MKATAKDLRIHLKELLATVGRGEEVIITYHGKPHAKLVPLETTETDKKVEYSLFGIWKINKQIASVDHYVRRLRSGRY